MRKFIAVVLGLIGLTFLVSTIVNIFVKDNDVTAFADEIDIVPFADDVAYPLTHVELPTNMIGLDTNFYISLPYDFIFEYPGPSIDNPVQDYISFTWFDGYTMEFETLNLKFIDLFFTMRPYCYSFGGSSSSRFYTFNCTLIPYVYVNNSWVSASSPANPYPFNLKNTYMHYYTGGVVNESTFDLQYYFSHTLDDSFVDGDCSIFIRFYNSQVNVPLPLLYSFQSPSLDIMMSPSYDPNLISETYQRGYDYGFEKGEQKGYLRGLDEGFDGDLFGSSLVPSINSLLSIEILPNVSFSRIFSIGWGLLLIGIAIKIFLGG